jgi:predicted ester cyclase
MWIRVEEQLAQDDLVATRWTSRGTQTGVLMGSEPTGKQVSVSGATISRLADGKLVESSTVGTRSV